MSFKDIVSKFGATSRPFDEGTEHFLTIDIGIIVRQLDLVKLATQQCRTNQPLVDLTQNKSFASSIDLHFLDLARKGRESLTDHIAVMFKPDPYPSNQKTLTELKKPRAHNSCEGCDLNRVTLSGTDLRQTKLRGFEEFLTL